MKKSAIFVLIAILILTVCVVIFSLFYFDGSTKNVVSENKTDVTIILDENCLKSEDKVVKAKLVVKNNNKFDINMFGFDCKDDDLQFKISSEGAYTISKDDVLELDFTVKFSEKAENQDYLLLLKNKSVLINFNSNSANQNDIITQIKPKIILGKVN